MSTHNAAYAVLTVAIKTSAIWLRCFDVIRANMHLVSDALYICFSHTQEGQLRGRAQGQTNNEEI